MNMIELQSATVAARKRLADPSIGTRVSDGAIQVVRVRFNGKGGSTVEPVSGPLSPQAAVRFLQAMQ